MYRVLCAGVEDPDDDLCALFDRLTNNGTEMKQYNDLLQKAVASLSRIYGKRAISNLLSDRGGVLPFQAEQISHATDLNSLHGW